MIKRIPLFAFLLLSVCTYAQKKDKFAKKMAATITAADMKKHLYTIASAEMEGRDTPSPGLEKAAEYIEAHFKSLGLLPGNKDSYRQYYPLYKDSMTGAGMVINGQNFELDKDFQPQTSNYPAEMRFSEVVFAGYGISDGDNRDDYKDLNVAGKLVMIIDGTPTGYKPSQSGFRSPASSFGKMNAAMKNGAAAILFVYNNFPRRAFNSNSNWSMNSYRSTQMPLAFTISPNIAAKIMNEDSKVLADKMKEGSLEPKAYDAEVDLSYSKTTQVTKVSNVLGLLEGTDLKDEYVVLTAHYDHVGKRSNGDIYYGADDDGSGTTGILELAEAFAEAKKAGKGPRRSILFMTVSGEEKGLWGSHYYSEHPVYPLEKTTVDLNIDMIGRIGTEYLKSKDSTNYTYIIGDDKLSSDLATITDQVNSTYTKLKLDRKYNDPNDPNRFYFRSDHYNFAQKGVPIIFYFNGTHADYHRPTDTPDKINYPLMAKRAQLVFYTAMEMANRNDMLKRDIKLEVPRGF
ncbi:MAG: M28 family peptidase [Chitinophagales bacterium]|nr:M28 family peptidase [Chitinophagales bacterium]